jgi:hypothetical protein
MEFEREVWHSQFKRRRATKTEKVWIVQLALLSLIAVGFGEKLH